MTKVAAVILAETAEGAERQARTAFAKGADLVELRLDYLREPAPDELDRLASTVGSRAIATLRSPAEGGAPGAADADRHSRLVEIASRPFAYLDIELKTDAEGSSDIADFAARQGTRLIVSHHFAKPVDASRVIDSLEACAAVGDVPKVAVRVDEIALAAQLVDIAQDQAVRGRRLILIGMGVAGTITRALADHAGQEIHYASNGSTAAAGQLPLRTATRLRGREPMVFGLTGHPLGHSLSPVIQEAALDASDLPAAYLPFDVDSRSLETLLDAADRLRIHGLNVTLPYKETIADKLDDLAGDATRLGVVNTVVIRDGWTTGHNTDGFGFRMSLRSLGLHLGDRRVLVVGAGGAARAVVDALVREGAAVQVVDRTMDRADALADGFGGRVDALSLTGLPRGGPWDLLVNATPVGTRGFDPGPPIPESVLDRVASVYDLVYNPPITPLMAAAQRLGKPAFSGLEMLLHQAARSFELWTGQSPPNDAMRRAAKEALG